MAMEASGEAVLGGSAPGGPVQAFFAPPGSPRLREVARAEGIYMWDTAGRRYIDISSGPVVNNLGHGNRRVLEAMAAQAARVTYAYPGQFQSAANVALGDLLARLAGPGLDRAFFVSGGSEATETALKLARQYAVVRGQPGRWKVIAREPGYHGGTLGAMAVSGDRHAEAIFGPLLKPMPKVPAPFTYRVPENHTPDSWARAAAAALDEEIRRQGPETVLAFIMEPVGGLATGALVAPDHYYKAVREICTRHGVLLIHDEVMCGAGRTGRFLAGEHWGVRPDLVTLAKGIAAGYTPFGAVLAPAAMVAAVAEAGGFTHGFTYISNPLSCAVALAVVQEVEERGLVGQAERMGTLLRQRLDDIAARSPIVGDVRGKGLLLAMELVADKASKAMIPNEMVAPARFQSIALDHGLAVYSRRTSAGRYGDWLMVSPPLIVTESQIDEMAALLERALGVYAEELRRAGVLR